MAMGTGPTYEDIIDIFYFTSEEGEKGLKHGGVQPAAGQSQHVSSCYIESQSCCIRIVTVCNEYNLRLEFHGLSAIIY
jgi:hypothetical protein